MEVLATRGSAALARTHAELLRRGRSVESRGGPARELTGYTLKVYRPWDVAGHADFLPGLAAAEALHLISGMPYGWRIWEITQGLVSQRWNSGHSFGVRLADDLRSVVTRLAEEPGTRQAVALVARPGDLDSGAADFYCATSLQFLIRNERSAGSLPPPPALELAVNWRSNDAWYGLPYNLFAFGQLQCTVADALGVAVGPLTFHVGSMHLYDRHRARAEALAFYNVAQVRGVEGRHERPRGRWYDATRRARALLLGEELVRPTTGELTLLGLLNNPGPGAGVQ